MKNNNNNEEKNGERKKEVFQISDAQAAEATIKEWKRPTLPYMPLLAKLFVHWWILLTQPLYYIFVTYMRKRAPFNLNDCWFALRDQPSHRVRKRAKRFA